MTERPGLPDSAEREKAWTLPSSLVVEASAGTGKTAMLTRRAAWFLLERGVGIERMVVLAFGEKAAAEARERLRKSLRTAMEAGSVEDLGKAPELEGIRAGLREVRERASRAFASFERGHVSTIHAFCSTILRLYPAEAGVDPAFKVVEEGQVESALREEWESFLAGELGNASSPRLPEWKELLHRVGFADLEMLGLGLAGFRYRDFGARPEARVPEGGPSGGARPEARVPEGGPPGGARPEARVPEGGPPGGARAGGTGVPETGVSGAAGAVVPEGKPTGAVAEWLKGLLADATALKEALAGSRAGKPLALAEAAARTLESFLSGTRDAPHPAPDLMKARWPDWLEPPLAAAGRRLVQAMRLLKGVEGEDLALRAIHLLRPFAERARARLIERGLMTYDAMVALAAGLLRGDKAVREQLKRRFDAVLVDEVQDVDPLQLELILWLSEKAGTGESDWRKVLLEPGKLVLVGDPKQSIYGFRGASFTAYRTVTGMALKQGAAKVELTTSMRSARPVIDLVNAHGPGLFPSDGEPAYLKLEANPARAPSAWAGAGILRVSSRGAEPAEVAEWVAGRIREGTARPGDVGILFRVARRMGEFGEQLKLRRVPVSVGDTRSFFLRREVADLVLAFRLCADPADPVALAGFLRSPYGGLDDAGLEAFFARWRDEGRPAGLNFLAGIAGKGPLAGTLKSMAGLSASLRSLPGRVWVGALWEGLLPAALADGSPSPGASSAVASFRVLLGDLLEAHGVNGALEVLEDCVRAEQRGANPPAGPGRPPESGLDEVRLMTVHQAKGLEFPVVVLADLAGGERRGSASETALLDDWATGLFGAVIHARETQDAVSTLEGACLKASVERREREELRRTLYVAMTRARERLVLSWPGGDTGRRTSEETFAQLLMPLACPGGPLAEEKTPAPASAPKRAPRPVLPAGGGGRRTARPSTGGEPWRETARREARVTVPALTRPSDIEERFVAPDGEEAPPAGRSAVQWLGELCHRALERWDFAGGADQAGRVVAEVAEGMGARARVPAAMARRAAEMLEAFAATDAAGELARAEILGREVPMLARVGDRVVSARADILFRLDGRLVVGDYKLAKYPKVAPEAAAAYEAVAAAALGEKAVFATISLGLGEIAYNPAGGGR